MAFTLNISSLGRTEAVSFSTEDFREASEAGLSFSQWLNRKVPTNEKDPGTAFEQANNPDHTTVDSNPYGIEAQPGEWAVADAGADTFVAGSAIFGKPDYKAVIDTMRANLAA